MAEAAKWLAESKEVQVVDVRRADEFKAGHLKGAVRVTWSEKGLDAKGLKKLSKENPVLVYCRSGRRSTAAAKALAEMGFKELRNLDGGITAWQKAGAKVVGGD